MVDTVLIAHEQHFFKTHHELNFCSISNFLHPVCGEVGWGGGGVALSPL